jgi:hypothetical protein
MEEYEYKKILKLCDEIDWAISVLDDNNRHSEHLQAHATFVGSIEGIRGIIGNYYDPMVKED